MFKLVIQDDEGKTTVVPLIRDEITIGRKEGNTIRLTERNVSRRHARIQRNNGAVTIEDLDSYNGILVNGARIQGRVELGESDRVQIGDYLLELKTDRAEAGANGSSPSTQPIERVDPMASTPVPEPMTETPSEAATRPMQAVPPADAQAPTPAAGYPAQAQAAAAVAAATPALADTDPGIAARTAQAARLVVLSSNFAGQDFSLDKPASVIGRTDDNDVVINHRSISRHHAKIVQEQGRFAIVDLQSSNGVRVNGEEYGKVELRRGDVIDLGHVRLRFVEAGEDFVLGRDAQIVDLAAESAGGKKSLIWAVLALLVVGGTVGVFAMRGGDTKETASSAGATADRGAQPAVDDRAVTPPSAPADATPDVSPPDGDEPNVATHLANARVALDSEQWADMQAAALEALNIDPTNAEAKRLKAQAERELKNEIQYGKFQDAVRRDDWSGIRANFDRIARDSVYKLRAQSDFDAKRDAYVASVRDESDALAAKGDCKGIQKVATRAGKAWPEARQAALDIMAACKRKATTVATRDDTKRDTTKRDTTKRDTTKRDGDDDDDDDSGDSGSGGSSDTSNKSPDQLADDASDEAKKGNYGRAYKLCEDALEVKPGHPRARMVCTIASCKLKNAKRAKRHYAKLSDSAKRAVKQLCAASGIKLE